LFPLYREGFFVHPAKKFGRPYTNFVEGRLFFVKLASWAPLFVPMFEYTLNHFHPAHFLSKNLVKDNKLSNLYFTQWAFPSLLFFIFTMAVYFFDMG
jgi:hypothetical protein